MSIIIFLCGLFCIIYFMFPSRFNTNVIILSKVRTFLQFFKFIYFKKYIHNLGKNRSFTYIYVHTH